MSRQMKVHRKKSPEQKAALPQRACFSQRSADHSMAWAAQEGLRSASRPLDGSARPFFESRFGHDFSQVRVHTGAEAAASARALDAAAYTVGNDVVFGAEHYAPETFAGRLLLAHELAHVVQQSAESGMVGEISQPGEAAEQEADVAAAQALSSGETSVPHLTTSQVAVQRQATAEAAASQTTPTRYNPPPELVEQRRIPADAQIIDTDTGPLYEAIMSAGWPRDTRWDSGWDGWSQITAFTSPDWVNQNLTNLTSGGGVSVDLAPHISLVDDTDYRLQMRARVVSVSFESADGVSISQGGTGGPSLSSQGSAGGSTSLGITGEFGAESPTQGGGKVSDSGGGSAGVSSFYSQQSGTSWAGSAQRGASATEGVRFRVTLAWDITIHQEINVGGVASIVSLGLLNLAAWIIEEPSTARAQTSSRVRFPKVRCDPVP